MTMYTNMTQHGGTFSAALDTEFQNADNITIASGYTSLSTINQFQDRLIDITRNGGESKLLLGMARYDGLEKHHLDCVTRLHDTLQNYNVASGVYIANKRPYHGKIYKFDSNGVSNFYVGSSNFSVNGIQKNIECTVPVLDPTMQIEITNFLGDLYSPQYSVLLNSIAINLKGTQDRRYNKAVKLWNGLRRHTIQYNTIRTNPSFAIILNRINKQTQSNLNVYFGKGRWSKTTGITTLRPWYEVELIARATQISNPLYPRGNFLAHTDDGLIIPMGAQGTNNKNIQSKDSLQIFGMWIKGKLERAGVLNMYKPITQATLQKYGNDEIRFYHLQGNEYYMKF